MNIEDLEVLVSALNEISELQPEEPEYPEGEIILNDLCNYYEVLGRYRGSKIAKDALRKVSAYSNYLRETSTFRGDSKEEEEARRRREDIRLVVVDKGTYCTIKWLSDEWGISASEVVSIISATLGTAYRDLNVRLRKFVPQWIKDNTNIRE